MNLKASQRNATENALLLALQATLAEGGRLTVEGIAARAGVNKALVYRYFGGLAGLVRAFAETPEFMPGMAELKTLCPPDLAELPDRQRFGCCVRGFVLALARRPASLQILQRLPQLDPEILEAIANGRKQAIEQIRALFGASGETCGFDPELAFSLLVSGACLLLGAKKERWHSNPIDIEELAGRICHTINGLLEAPSSEKTTPARP